MAARLGSRGRTRLTTVLATVATLAVVGSYTQTASALTAAGGEIVLIESVKVGSPMLQSESACTGYVDYSNPIVPVTIVATFVPPPDDEPTGPYATASWSGGFGSSDDHFSTGEAHATTQVFHILMRTSPQLYSGFGTYWVSVTVQDVGLAGGFATRDGIPVELPPPPPSRATAHVKCSPVEPFDLASQLGDLAMAAAEQLAEEACGLCMKAYNLIQNAQTYSEILDHLMGDLVDKDPPDADYQEIAAPSPPPVLPVPAGLSPDQQNAGLSLEQGLADGIGVMRALMTSINRVWGADSDGNRYWYHRQMQAVAGFAAQAADAYDALPQLFDDLQAALAPGLPQFPVSALDAAGYLAGIAHGVPDTDAAILTQLGIGPEAQQAIIDERLAVDPDLLVTADGVGALFKQNFGGFVGPLRSLASWAAGTASADPPVVTSVSPTTLPSSGGAEVDIRGANLDSVTGINFGPSSPAGGQGLSPDCVADECWVHAPPGTGTVDVVAIGPGGPSDERGTDQVTYVDAGEPQVARIYPAAGAKTAYTWVTVFGSGLAGGVVYFGPTIAKQWTCTDTSCKAQTQLSASVLTVDVTVATSGGTSPTVPGDQFTFLANAPPPAPAPAVSEVSPNHGSDLGGDQVTIAGTGFTGATQVRFGGTWGSNAPAFAVVDDAHVVATTPYHDSGTVDVVVQTPAGTSATSPADAFTYDPPTAPTVAEVTPNTGPDIGGTRVTITGTDFGGANTYVIFGDAFTGDAVCTTTTCTVTAPPHADGVVDVKVGTDDGFSSPVPADGFTYTPGPLPTIAEVSPDTGTVDGGTSVAIFGAHLNGGTVEFGDQPADGTCTTSTCVVTSPAQAAGPVDVRVTTEAGTSAPTPADLFGYVRLAAPVVQSLDPTTGWVSGGDTVNVYGTDLTGGRVFFGAHEAWYVTCSRSACTAQTPGTTTVGPVHVTVQTPSGTSATSAADEFSYFQPEITGVTPSTGWTYGGTKVTVTGHHLASGLGSDSLLFGTNNAVSATCTESTCTATAPAHAAGTVDVQVHPRATYSPVTPADEFTFLTQPAPVVTGISPSAGTHSGGDSVTVTGTDLDGGKVKFGTTLAAFTCSSTSCTGKSPAHADGSFDVTVTTTTHGNSATSAADLYTFSPPGTPTVTGVSPGSGPSVGGGVVTVTGANLTNGIVKFGTVPGTGTSCTVSACTSTSPAHAVGAVDVRVTIAGTTMTSAANESDTFTYVLPPAPAVTGVYPDSGPASGGSDVIVSGTNLYGATVAFDAKPATHVTCTATSCTVRQPAGAPGVADVTVTTPGGTSPVTTVDHFTYAAVTLTEHAIPGVSAATGGGAVTRGIGGDMWFTMPSRDKIGRVASDGTVTTYATPTSPAMPDGIVLGPDGRMWYTEQKVNAVVAIDGAGAQQSFPIPGTADDIRFITSGPDGRLWFTLVGSDAIGALTTSGTLSLYKVPAGAGPYNILAGADGRLWFTEVVGNNIGAITTDGEVTEYPLPDAGARSWGISRGPDKRIWFAEAWGRAIGAVTTHGDVTMYPVPVADPNPQGITYGADGRMWFAAPDIDQVSALDPATGEVVDYALPGGPLDEQPRYLASDADGTLWVTEYGGDTIASISGIASPAIPTISDVSPDHGGAGDSVTITGTNLADATTVTFGSTTAAAYTVTDPGHVDATVPAGENGTVSVRVTTPSGTSAPVAAAEFGYGPAPAAAPAVTGVRPSSGTTAGGDTVTITGSDLAGGTVTFGTTAAAGASCAATFCTATSPAHALGTVDLTVTTAGGTSAVSAPDEFTYLVPPPPAPAVTGVSPASGSTGGGESVTITGTDLAGGTVVFGLDRASATCTATSCTATTPRGATGVVDVRVDTDGGRSARNVADRFTYVAPSTLPTTTALGASPSPSRVGKSVTLTAVVTPAAAAGQVQFKDGATDLGPPVAVVAGQAQKTVSTLSAGTHALHAVFTPADPGGYAGSTGDATLSVGRDLMSISAGGPRTVAYASSLVLSTRLANTTMGTAVPGAQVSLYRRAASESPWSKLAARTTTSSGAASVSVTPTGYTQYQWRFAGDPTRAPATSSAQPVSVAQVVVVRVTRTTVRRGTTVRIYGWVKPSGAGRSVTLQRRAGTSWQAAATATLTRARLPDGTLTVGYVFTVTPARVGTVVYRVYRPATSTLLKGYSATVTIKAT